MVLLFLRCNLQYRDIFIDCCCVFWLWKMEALCGLGGDDGRRGEKSILKVDQVWAGTCFSFAMLLRANVFYCLCHGVSIKKSVKSLFLLFCCSSLRWNKRQLSRNGLSGCGVVFRGTKYFFSLSLHLDSSFHKRDWPSVEQCEVFTRFHIDSYVKVGCYEFEFTLL